MSDYISHIDTDAVELELMERYLAGSLNEEEKKAMEENLAEDPILADALEGLALIEDKEAMKLALGRIQAGSRKRINKFVKKRDQLSKRRSRVEYGNFKLANYYVAAAAAVAVLICTVWVIRITPRSEMASSKDMAIAESEVAPTEQTTRSDMEEITTVPLATDTLKKVEDTQSPNLRAISPVEEKAPIAMRKVPTETVTPKKLEATSDEQEIGNSSLVDDAMVLSEEEKILEVESREAKIAMEAPQEIAETAQKSDSKQTLDQDEALNNEALPVERKQEEVFASESLPGATSYIAPMKDSAPILSPEGLSQIPLESREEADRYNELEQKSKRSRTASSAKKSKKTYDAMPTFPEQSEADKMYGKLSKGQHMADLMLEAIALYEVGENEKSLTMLKEVLQSSPSNPAANYYTGSIYQRYSQMKTASSYLKEAVKYPESPLIEEARWKLAQVYLARNKNGMAKKLLQLIAEEGSKYAEQARAELLKL